VYNTDLMETISLSEFRKHHIFGTSKPNP